MAWTSSFDREGLLIYHWQNEREFFHSQNQGLAIGWNCELVCTMHVSGIHLCQWFVFCQTERLHLLLCPCCSRYPMCSETKWHVQTFWLLQGCLCGTYFGHENSFQTSNFDYGTSSKTYFWVYTKTSTLKKYWRLHKLSSAPLSWRCWKDIRISNCCQRWAWCTIYASYKLICRNCI